jgi:superfamily I DNA and/or RNA helicase
MLAATVERIYLLHRQKFDTAKTVGVIVPYRNQISAVRNAIDAYGHPELHDITIDTVERFQGSQRDYILYGFTVQRTYQLNFLSNNTFEEDGMLIDRKLNVAMTRARKHLLMFGNPEVICEDPVFQKLVDYVKTKGYWIDVPAERYVAGGF